MATSKSTPEITENILRRFWAKVEKGPDCWNWTASVGSPGYGQLGVDQWPVAAHRLSWAIHNGRWPTLDILHACDNRRCVNPAHLSEGTAQENARQMVDRFRDSNGSRWRLSRTPTAKLNLCEVRACRALFRDGYAKKDIAKLFSVTPTNIYYIVRRVTYYWV